MPFKGDMRLGGPHDNERSLNGTASDFDSVPVAGTLLGDARVEYDVGQGGQEVTYYIYGSTYHAPSQTVIIDYRADGIGGQYVDWTNKRDEQYKPYGTSLYAGGYTGTTTVEINGLTYESGTYTGDFIHDGGGYYATDNVTYNYLQGSIFYEEQAYTAEFNGQTFAVGTRMVYYSHDGGGGFTASYDSPSWYPDYTVVGSSSYSNYFDITDVGTGFLGSNVTEDVQVVNHQLEWVGNGNVDYTPSGTYIGEFEGTYYYHNGEGYYYTSSTGPNGEGGGGGDNGYTLYINIGGTDYPNGWYDNETASSSYYSYGDYITYYDGFDYYHDGNGGYTNYP